MRLVSPPSDPLHSEKFVRANMIEAIHCAVDRHGDRVMKDALLAIKGFLKYGAHGLGSVCQCVTRPQERSLAVTHRKFSLRDRDNC